MQKNKKIIIVIIFLSLVFFGASFFVINKERLNQLNKYSDKVKKNDITLDLPELKCNFSSDQEAYEEANKSNNLENCSCIEDKQTAEICKTSVIDTILYTRALDYLDEEFCKDIKTEIHKDACYSVVRDSVNQLKKSDPQRLANIYSTTHNDSAIENFEKIISEGDVNIENYVSLVLSYAEKALKEQEQGRDRNPYLTKALDIIKKAKIIDANNSEVYRAEGYVNEIKPDYESAMNSYNKAIQINPENTLAYAGKGHTARLIGDLSKAVEYFNKAAQLDSEDRYVSIYSNLCTLEFSRSNYDESLKNCKIVVNKIGTDPTFQSDSYQVMANIFMLKQNFIQANNYLLKAKTLTPNNSNLYILLSKLNILEEKYGQSEENAKKAISLSPTKAIAYLALAQSLYIQEKHQDSIDIAQKGLTLVQDDVSLLVSNKPGVERDLYYSLSNNYRQLGDEGKQKEYEQKGNDIFNKLSNNEL